MSEIADTTVKQVILVFKLIGTEGVLDEPEGDYKVKYAEDIAEQLKQLMLNEGLKYPNYGWSVIQATVNNPQ